MVKIVIMFIALSFSTKVMCIENSFMQSLEGTGKEWIENCKRIKTAYLQKLQRKKTFTKIKAYDIKKLKYHLFKVNKFHIPALINIQGLDELKILGSDVFMYFKSKLGAMTISLDGTNIFNDYWSTNRKNTKLGIKLTQEIYKGKLSAVLLNYDSYRYKPEDIRCSIKSKFQDARIINVLPFDLVNIGTEYYNFNKVVEIKDDNFKGYIIIKKNNYSKKSFPGNYIVELTLFDDIDTVMVKYSMYSKDILKVYKYAYLIKKMISYKDIIQRLDWTPH